MYFYLLFFVISLAKVTLSAPTNVSNEDTSKERHPDRCKIVVIAHRGASGYVPEHTLGAYALAVTMGADYVEPDLVMTSDGHLVARHENELSMTTNIAEHSDFATRHCTKTIDGANVTGWFTEDFTLAELKTLRVIERIPDLRPGNARMDGSFTIPTFEEIIGLIKSFQYSQKRVIGIYPEIKHSTYFKQLGLPMERAVVEMFRKNGYSSSTDPVYIQSFEVTNLRELKNYTDLRLLQLFKNKITQPFDQAISGTKVTYGAMATAEGLREVAKYAAAVGPDKSYIIPRDESNRLGSATSFVTDAHLAGLKVHPYTFRAENFFLPAEFQSKDRSPFVTGDLSGEMRAYLATGIDGVFSEHPDVSIRVRGKC